MSLGFTGQRYPFESPETPNFDPDKCCSVCTNGTAPIVYIVHSALSQRLPVRQ